MRLRLVPEIRFILDESIERGMRVLRILETLEKERQGESGEPTVFSSPRDFLMCSLMPLRHPPVKEPRPRCMLLQSGCSPPVCSSSLTVLLLSAPPVWPYLPSPPNGLLSQPRSPHAAPDCDPRGQRRRLRRGGHRGGRAGAAGPRPALRRVPPEARCQGRGVGFVEAQGSEEGRGGRAGEVRGGVLERGRGAGRRVHGDAAADGQDAEPGLVAKAVKTMWVEAVFRGVVVYEAARRRKDVMGRCDRTDTCLSCPDVS